TKIRWGRPVVDSYVVDSLRERSLSVFTVGISVHDDRNGNQSTVCRQPEEFSSVASIKRRYDQVFSKVDEAFEELDEQISAYTVNVV
ncbi:hypothetical protein X801_02548, partial [Opisthorchis viverrini]